MIKQLSLIAALDAANGIGKDNDLMWNLPADMRFFKETTKGHVVIMGRKNYDSIPEKYRPLAGRTNVVLSRKENFSAPDCLVFDSFENCMASLELAPDQKAFIIGGAEIYKVALASGLVHEMYLTHIDKTYGADTFFPDFKVQNYRKEPLFTQAIDEKHEAGFTAYRYELL
ncbi:MAG: dihydrofolate reductase [Flavobacteriales bacterium]